MAKLQLYIAKSLRGYKSLVNFNPAEDVRRFVGDFRQALEGVGYDAAAVNVFYLLAYREQGVMITIMRTIPDGPGDHLAATIFVPDGLEIKPEALCDVLNQVRRRILEPAMDANAVGELRALFAADYPRQSETPAKVNSEGRHYAYALYGGSAPAFDDYAADGFYSPTFADYAGVLLVDAEAGFDCKGIDLTPERISPLIPLAPPPESPEGFVPHIYRRTFNTPFLVPSGEPLQISWRRGGFENIEQTVTPDSADFEVPGPDTSQAVKTITPSSFYITAQRSQESLHDAVVRVNGCEIKGPVNFTFAELSPAQIEINAPGFFPFSGKLDLASTTQALVQMKELRKIYRFDLPVLTPEPVDSVHFTIQTKKELPSCPVEGYAVSGDGLSEGISRTNTLVYVGGRGRRSILTAIVTGIAGIVLGFLAGWLTAGFVSDENTDVTIEEAMLAQEEHNAAAGAAAAAISTETVVIPASDSDAAPAQPAAPAATEAPSQAPAIVPAATQSYEAAKAYLDSHRNWNRSEMAQAMPGLEGLFDAMNEYRFDEIKTVWATRLDGSRNFATVLAAVNGASTKRDPRTGAHAPKYNRDGDNVIGWRGYTYWVDP